MQVFFIAFLQSLARSYLSPMYRNCLLLGLLLLICSCKNKEEVDLFIHNAHVYTVDSGFSSCDAVVIKDGRILETGSFNDLGSRYKSRETIDAKGQFVYPGFIDAHAHFWGYAMNLETVDLTGSRSWEDVLSRVVEFSRTHTTGWITGRGWDQNDWDIKQFPSRDKLDSLFPDRPVLLRRVDGHAAIANGQALLQAGIKAGQDIPGGQVHIVDGKLTGLLVDNAVDLVIKQIPPAGRDRNEKALLEAQQHCFAAGLTTVADCGLDYYQVLFLDTLQRQNKLKMGLYVLLSDGRENINFLLKHGAIQTDRLQMRGIKLYADGALGSRGACLHEPYSDFPGHHGTMLSKPEHFDSVAALMYKHGFQVCTHAIGDSGNRVILGIYGKYLKQANDRRWRIEHAQVVTPADMPLFARYSIIPSVQPTHATSDMYWA
ncbi:MAG: amidohydrolase, partial [Sphingobacteriales bacterium]